MVSADAGCGSISPMFPRDRARHGRRVGIGAAIVELLRAEGADVRALDLADGFDVSRPGRHGTTSAPVELACLNAGVTTGRAAT